MPDTTTVSPLITLVMTWVGATTWAGTAVAETISSAVDTTISRIMERS